MTNPSLTMKRLTVADTMDCILDPHKDSRNSSCRVIAGVSMANSMLSSLHTAEDEYSNTYLSTRPDSYYFGPRRSAGDLVLKLQPPLKMRPAHPTLIILESS
jgi:hypothetical protein